MIFANSQYLMALAVLPLMAVLFLLVALRKREVIARMGEPDLLGRLAGSHSADRRIIKTGLVMAALACALLSAARPQAGWQLTRGSTRGIDLIVALDVSASMLAEDVKPSRLDRAKSELAALISSMRGSRVAIIAFAGSAVPVCPLTSDSRAARMFLDALEWGVVEEPGTDLGEAIDRALRSFDSAEDRSRAILIASDGEDHEGGLVEATDRAVEVGVPVYCVGVGGEAGVPIPLAPGGAKKGLRKDSDGQIVLTSLNGQILKDLAFAAGGSMNVLGPSGGSLRGLESDLEKLPTKERPTTYTHRDERFYILALVSLCLLALDWFISERRRASAAVVILVTALVTLGSASPVSASSARDALKLYDEGDYLGALAKFREELEKSPSPSLYYDVGNSLYRLDKFEEAVRHYMGSVEEAGPSLEMNARYNTGNCLFNDGNMEGAIEQYIEALKLNPADEDAKHNLELALRRLQESQQSPQEGQGGNGEQQDESRNDESAESQDENRGGEGDQEGESQDQGRIGEEQGEETPERPDSREVDQSRSRFSEEEAKRLLEALAGDEKDLLSKRMKSKVRRKGVKKNW